MNPTVANPTVMHPQIGFKQILKELSVNRQDPCEVLRELISNSYDAGAKKMYYLPLLERKGFIFFDDGEGLSTTNQTNGITPWEAFFSIGKSTKTQGGPTVGYKCQGSKLLFASTKVFVATKEENAANSILSCITINKPEELDPSCDITPTRVGTSQQLSKELQTFYGVIPQISEIPDALKNLDGFINASNNSTWTLIVVDGLETRNFPKYFDFPKTLEDSYVYNYIQFYTRHGDVRWLTGNQGFDEKAISSKTRQATFGILYDKKIKEIPFGYPYLKTREKVTDPISKNSTDTNIKSPKATRPKLKEGKFYSRAAKTFSVGENKYHVVFLIDGYRRVLDEYKTLDRQGTNGTRSGIKLASQRGLFISVNGVKICKYEGMFSTRQFMDYAVLEENLNYYSIIIEGNFNLVTNRNSLSEKILDAGVLNELKIFLDDRKANDAVFSELLSKLNQDRNETDLKKQEDILEKTRNALTARECFFVTDNHKKDQLFLSPQPGEEYLVGVLYAALFYLLPLNSPYQACWKRIITFSTQGIDSFGLDDNNQPLVKKNILAIEYKYSFSNDDIFNHALLCVDYIVAWEVNVVNSNKDVQDDFTCYGKIKRAEKEDEHHEWEIYAIEGGKNNAGHVVRVINLRKLIEKTFKSQFYPSSP